MQDWSPEDLKVFLDSGDGVFLKLWKKGCGACELSKPALARLEAANTQQLKFGQISTDEFPEILEITDTEVLPAFFVFRDSKQLGKLEGFKGLERLKNFVDASVSA